MGMNQREKCLLLLLLVAVLCVHIFREEHFLLLFVYVPVRERVNIDLPHYILVLILPPVFFGESSSCFS